MSNQLRETWQERDLGYGRYRIYAERHGRPQGISGVRQVGQTYPEQNRGANAETACGARIQIDGEISLTGQIDSLAYHSLLGYERHNADCIYDSWCEKENILTISEDGGTITIRATRKVVRLHETQGVYFFKTKLLPAQSQSRYTHLGRLGFIRLA